MISLSLATRTILNIMLNAYLTLWGYTMATLTLAYNVLKTTSKVYPPAAHFLYFSEKLVTLLKTWIGPSGHSADFSLHDLLDEVWSTATFVEGLVSFLRADIVSGGWVEAMLWFCS